MADNNITKIELNMPRSIFSDKTLELAIIDFCNLDCPLCSQATPLQKDKKVISLTELQNVARFIKPYEFYTIKISGGEPTLHPQFDKICEKLRIMFPAHDYILATNGANVEKYKDYLHVFDKIDLTRYPGRNDELFRRLISLNIPNVTATTKRDNIEMENIYQKRNICKNNIYKRCIYSRMKKIVGSRIYPCCVIFGQAVRNNIDLASVSVVLDEQWRENLAKVNIDRYCKDCYIEASWGSFITSQIRFFYSIIKKRAKIGL